MNWLERLEGARNTRLFTIADTSITPGTLAAFFVVLMGTLLLSNLVRSGLQRALAGKGVDEGTAAVVGTIANYLILTMGFAVALETIGIGVSTLFAAGALFAVGIGLSLQSIMQNFVSGLILLTERSVRPGDVLEIEGGMVRVVRMGIRASVVVTRDGENLIVPNSNIVQSSVKNYTLDHRMIRIRANVGVAYHTDMAMVRQVLEKILAEITWRVRDQEPAVLMLGFGDNSVNFEVALWIDEPWLARKRTSDLYEAIWFALRDANVTIAFPQLDVHLDSSVESALRGR